MMTTEGAATRTSATVSSEPEVTAYSWYVVAVGMAVSLLAILDRQVLSLLVEPIKADLAISDVQFSLLTGLAFSLFYATCGLPMGAIVDRGSRVKTLAAGLLVWSAATVASGFARSYALLFACRAVVGVGEAVLQPATKSMITDMFYGRHLGKAISLVALGSSLGSGFALILGGAILHSIGDTEFVSLPFIDSVRPWQFVLICVGLPGVLLAPICLLTVKEPKRRRVLIDATGADAAATYRELFRFVRTHARAVLCVVFGYSIYSMAFQGVIAWSPAFLIRQHGLSAADVGATLGPLTLAINVVMTLGSGWWIDHRIRRGTTDAPLRWSLTAAVIGIAPIIIFPHLQSTELALTALVIGIVGTTGYVIGSIPLMQIMPSQLRGKAMVSYLMISNIVSGIFGPYFVALLNDKVFQDPTMVGHSLSIVAGTALAVAIVLLTSSLRSFRRSMSQLNTQTR